MIDIKMVVTMSVKRAVWRELWKIHRYYATDPTYSLRKGIQLMFFYLCNERIVEHEGSYVISTFMPPFLTKPFFTNIIEGVASDEPFKNQLSLKRKAPISLYLEVTKKCNLSCSHCSSYYNEAPTDLSLHEWKRIIGEVQDMGTTIIGITGGEPLLRSDIIEMVEAIDERSSAILFTNGYVLTKKIAQQLKSAGLFAIGISLDSPIEGKHNDNRGDIRAFEKAVEAIKIAHSAGLYTMCQTVILRKDLNKREVLDFFAFCKKLGVDEMKVLEPIRSGRYLGEDKRGEIFYTNEDRAELIAIQHYANRVRSKYPKVTTFAYTESFERYGCGAGVQHSYINASGELMPCDFVPMSFGSVVGESVADLWQKMTHELGSPKRGCFANKVNREIAAVAQGALPLEIESSKKLCRAHRESEKCGFEKILV